MAISSHKGLQQELFLRRLRVASVGGCATRVFLNLRFTLSVLLGCLFRWLPGRQERCPTPWFSRYGTGLLAPATNARVSDYSRTPQLHRDEHDLGGPLLGEATTTVDRRRRVLWNAPIYFRIRCGEVAMCGGHIVVWYPNPGASSRSSHSSSSCPLHPLRFLLPIILAC